ncbi:MAG: hypothetical protein HYX53_01435 [Chloroflexi bacterium]|nr:hypothetical protein [Chloroflexota bacterium]
MKLLRRGNTPAATTAPPSAACFGAWVLRQFAQGRLLAELPFAELERTCANAASVIFGAAMAAPEALDLPAAHTAEAAAEARIVALRTANGFKAALDDRRHTVLAWPWEHLATRVAWQAAQAGAISEDTLGLAMQTVTAAYSRYHRDQLETVVGLWEQVVRGIRAGSGSGGRTATAPDLAAMGRQMVEAWHAASEGSGHAPSL